VLSADSANESDRPQATVYHFRAGTTCTAVNNSLADLVSFFASLLNALIEGLQHPCIDCGDHIHSRVQLFFRHACFPCIRKAPIHSRIAEPHHCDREADQHLLALSEAFDGVRIAVECPKIGFFHVIAPVRERAQDAAPLRSQTSALVPQH
jgi:hypothetical protein